MADDETADDGSIHHFWEYVARVLRERSATDWDPNRLDNVRELLRAVQHFDAGDT